MKIGIIYNVLHSGGCEKRAAEIALELRRRGDEVFILGSGLTHEGAEMLFGHCGLPREWVLTSEGEEFNDWVRRTVAGLGLDVCDVQWACQVPQSLGKPTVVTAHGDVPMPDAGAYDWQAFIQVETFEPHYYARALCPIYSEVWNWVDLARFPFQDQVGDGVAYFGRLFKTGHLRAIWDRIPCRVDVYGMKYPEDEFPWPPRAKWHGFVETPKVIGKYRVIFGGARVALEALASGRSVLAGYAWPNWIAWADAVTPHNVAQMARRQFVSRCRADGVEQEPTVDHIWEQFERAYEQMHNPVARGYLRGWVETEHNLQVQVSKIRRVYEQVLAC